VWFWQYQLPKSRSVQACIQGLPFKADVAATFVTAQRLCKGAVQSSPLQQGVEAAVEKEHWIMFV